MDLGIAGRKAIVCASSRGLGRGCAEALAEAGCDVVINGRDMAALDDVANTLAKRFGATVTIVAGDVSQPEVQAALFAACPAPDILVNSAGLFQVTRLPTEDVATWTRVVDTSIHGTFFVTNAFAPSMLAKGAGVIVNVLDTSIDAPWRHFSAHAAGKAGMEALTRQFALEFAPAVRVNAVVLGMVLPPAGHTQAKLDRAAARTLLGRIGTPADATQAVRYLIEADYVTGECLRVDGGERYGPRPI